MGRPKHPNKHCEAVLKQAERQGWRVEKGRKYYRLKCKCEGQHMKTMHMSPSDPNYLKNWRRQMARDTCWEDR